MFYIWVKHLNIVDEHIFFSDTAKCADDTDGPATFMQILTKIHNNMYVTSTAFILHINMFKRRLHQK